MLGKHSPQRTARHSKTQHTGRWVWGQCRTSATLHQQALVESPPSEVCKLFINYTTVSSTAAKKHAPKPKEVRLGGGPLTVKSEQLQLESVHSSSLWPQHIHRQEQKGGEVGQREKKQRHKKGKQKMGNAATPCGTAGQRGNKQNEKRKRKHRSGQQTAQLRQSMGEGLKKLKLAQLSP